MKILFINAQILDFNKRELLKGDVEISDGIITKVGTFTPDKVYDEIIDCQMNLLMPGFVNAHCHTPMTILRSLNDLVELNEWLFDYILPAESKLTSEDVYWGEMLGIMESVRGGITCFEEGYFHNDSVCRALEKSGIRARIGIGPAIGDNGMSNAEYLEKCVKQINETPLIHKSCFIHAIYTTSEQKIKESIEFAKQKQMAMSIHLAETKKEFDECLATRQFSPTQYLNSIGLFDLPCLCYHSIYLTDEDISILKQKNVSVATCPSSNLKLGSGIAPIRKMLDKGINICIGTDGVASNNNLDMFKEMFLVANLEKTQSNNYANINPVDIIKMATLNGAKALGINSGEIGVGKNADIILVDINQPHYFPQENLLSHLVYAGKSSDIILTMIGGKVIYDKGKYFLPEAPNVIFKKVNDIRAKIK